MSNSTPDKSCRKWAAPFKLGSDNWANGDHSLPELRVPRAMLPCRMHTYGQFRETV